MKKKYTIAPLALLGLMCLTQCYYVEWPLSERHRAMDTTRVDGYVPVYGSPESQEIVMTGALAVVDPGKIYVYGNYLLINEKKKGIHIFNNADPAEPVNLGFLQLLGNTDMAMKDGLLYADHMGNLVALNVNDFKTIVEEGRLALRNWNFGLPPPSGYSFECTDPAKGFVVSWKKAKLLNPGCYAF